MTVLNPQSDADEGRYSVLVRFGALCMILDMQALVPDGYHNITVFVALKLIVSLFWATCSTKLAANSKSTALMRPLVSGTESLEANAVSRPCSVQADNAVIKHKDNTPTSLTRMIGIHLLISVSSI